MPLPVLRLVEIRYGNAIDDGVIHYGGRGLSERSSPEEREGQKRPTVLFCSFQYRCVCGC